MARPVTGTTAPTSRSLPGWAKALVPLVAVALIGVVAKAVTSGNDDDGAAPSGTQGPGEIFREPQKDAGPDPFTQSVAKDLPLPSTTTAVTTSLRTTTSGSTIPATTGGGRVLVSYSGGTPGLYGGTQNLASCDPAQLVTFLEQNADKGKAWAAAQGIEPAKIREYVDKLTPVTLEVDTRVTNNGFLNGQATPRQAVLQAGTAVLVDEFGTPRVRCYCGNPLQPPAAQASTTYTGPSWPTFNPDQIAVVTPEQRPLENLILRNDATGLGISRPVGSTGEVDRPAPAPPPLPTLGGAPSTAPTTTTTITTTRAATTVPATTLSSSVVPRTGLQTWLAADQGVVADASGKVSKWSDQSGTGHDATQANLAAQPTLRTSAINTRPALQFDGTDDALVVSVDINPATVPNLTVIAVFASDTNATTSPRKVYSHDDGGYDRTAGLDSRAATNYSIYSGTGVGDYFVLSANTPYQTTDSWGPTQFNGRVNGRAVTTQPVASVPGLSKLAIGSNPSFGEYWMGPIAEFLVYNRLLTTTEQSQLESYLAAKYRI